MTAYYTLYDNTVDALTAVIPNVLVGGPSTTNAGPVSAFLAHCKSANKRVTFVSSHVYPGGCGNRHQRRCRQPRQRQQHPSQRHHQQRLHARRT